MITSSVFAASSFSVSFFVAAMPAILRVLGPRIEERATASRTGADGPRTTISATSSYGVSSRFRIASAPPARTVSPGSPATGHTCSDDPTTRSSPVSRASAPRLHRVRREKLAEHHDPGLHDLGALPQRGASRVSAGRGSHRGLVAAAGEAREARDDP